MRFAVFTCIIGSFAVNAGAGCGSEAPSTNMGAMTLGGTPALPATGGTPAVGTAGTPAQAGRPGAGIAGSPAAGGGAGASALPVVAGTTASAGAGGVLAVAGSSAAGSLGSAGSAGLAAAGGGAAGSGAAGMSSAGAGGGGAVLAPGSCCKDGKCICRDDAPTALTAEAGKYKTESYSIQGVGCVYYPTDAEPPFSAVAISDGYGGSGGCGRTQTDQWGPLYASYGIVTMIVVTGSGDQPNQRGRALTEGIAAFKSENMKSGSPLYQKLAGRYGTSGFSMGGGGTSFASQADDTLLSSVAIMPWGPVRSGVEVPTLVICGASDNIASCASHGTPLYQGIADSVPKMRVQVSGGHAGQPTAGGRNSGKYGLAFTKAFLDGDERWLTLLKSAESESSNIK